MLSRTLILTALAVGLWAQDKEAQRDADREMKLSKKLVRQQVKIGKKQDEATKTATELQQLQKVMDARCATKGQRMGRQGAMAVCFTPQPAPPPNTTR